MWRELCVCVCVYVCVCECVCECVCVCVCLPAAREWEERGGWVDTAYHALLGSAEGVGCIVFLRPVNLWNKTNHRNCFFFYKKTFSLAALCEKSVRQERGPTGKDIDMPLRVGWRTPYTAETKR